VFDVFATPTAIVEQALAGRDDGTGGARNVIACRIDVRESRARKGQIGIER